MGESLVVPRIWGVSIQILLPYCVFLLLPWECSWCQDCHLHLLQISIWCIRIRMHVMLLDSQCPSTSRIHIWLWEHFMSRENGILIAPPDIDFNSCWQLLSEMDEWEWYVDMSSYDEFSLGDGFQDGENDSIVMGANVDLQDLVWIPGTEYNCIGDLIVLHIDLLPHAIEIVLVPGWKPTLHWENDTLWCDRRMKSIPIGFQLYPPLWDRSSDCSSRERDISLVALLHEDLVCATSEVRDSVSSRLYLLLTVINHVVSRQSIFLQWFVRCTKALDLRICQLHLSLWEYTPTNPFFLCDE